MNMLDKLQLSVFLQPSKKVQIL